jgi:nitrate/TMAO reductase-like tetraheme cytochrome c subunit
MKRLIALTVVLIAAGGVYADNLAPASVNQKWKAECSSCHLAYPPAAMDAAGWRRVMGSLDRHFGADASLDAASVQEITRYLEQNAARQSKRANSDPAGRITQSPWFQREHREVAAATWKQPQIKSAANCSACHPRAEQFRFSEREIVIPGIGRIKE